VSDRRPDGIRTPGRQRLKITFINTEASLAGGVKVVAIYAEQLKKRGHEVVVVSRPPYALTIRERVRALVKERRWLRPSPPGSHFDGRDLDHRVLERRRPVVEADVPDADVIVATFWLTANWISSFSRAKGAKVLFIQGYEVLPGETKPHVDATWRLPFQKIVISHWLKELAASEFHDPNALHVPNSVDLDQFHAPRRGMRSTPTLGFLFHTSPFKGMEVAFSAIEKVRSAVPQLRVVSFGAERPHGDLSLPAGTEFHLQPPQSSIRDIYAECDVWLCASRREGFHLPPLEAMACRCPVVSTRVGGPQDIVEQGVNGYLVEVGDAEGLAAAAVRVLRDGPDAWRKMSDAAHATATRYTWDDATDLFETALKTAVDRMANREIPGGAREVKA
jgi:glycosyltransferase involved in cell wall biosynthesis